MSGYTAALLGVTHPHSVQGHLRTLQTLPEVERIVLWDSNAQALDATRQAYSDKVVGATTSLDAVLSDPAVFFVVTAVRNDLAPDVNIRALEAGKHVLAEKPMGRDASEVARVVQAVERSGRVLSVLYQNRYNPVVSEARRLVQAGLLGPLMSVEARFMTTQVHFREPDHWLFSRERAGGGILSWLGCHWLDVMRYVTGDDVTAVSAEVATRSGEAIDVEDVATLALRFQSGAIGALHMGYVLAQSGSGYFASGYDAYVGIRGRLGRVYWDPTSAPPRLFAESLAPEWSAAPKQQFQYEPRPSPAYGGGVGEAFVRDFLAACRDEGDPPTTARDALWVARLLDAAYESSRTGRRVEIQGE